MKKSLAFFAIALLHFPFACQFDDGGCGSFDERGRYAGIDSDLGTYFEELGYRTWTRETPRSYEEFYLRVFPEDIEYFSDASPVFSLTSLAYACSPPAPEFPLIEEISIVSDAAFIHNNQQISAGDLVNHLFRVRNSGNISIADYIEKQNRDFYLFGDFGTSIILGLRDAPTDTLESSFSVLIELADGTTHQTQTPVYRVY